jgi:hypothetical protein
LGKLSLEQALRCCILVQCILAQKLPALHHFIFALHHTICIMTRPLNKHKHTSAF